MLKIYIFSMVFSKKIQISQSSVLLRNGQQKQFVEVSEKQKEVFLDFKKIDFKAPKFAFFSKVHSFC